MAAHHIAGVPNSERRAANFNLALRIGIEGESLVLSRIAADITM
jgi:hypothetical protein